MAYPTGEDLLAFLEAAEFTIEGNLDCDAKIAAAITAFEQDTNRQPFLASSTPSARTFTAHRGNLLILPPSMSLVSVSSVTVNGTAYTPGTDLMLLPENAPLIGRPYTRLRFGQVGFANEHNYPGFPSGVGTFATSLPGTVIVTGIWGYCSTLPDDVRNALLAYGALLSAPQLALMISGGLYSERRLNSEVRYGGGGVTPLASEVAMWQAIVDACVKRYKAPGL